MKTINFCGDSFACMDGPTEVKLLMWQSILAKKLNCTITGTGKSGTAYEHAIRSFDDKTDYTIFCWTDAARLWTKENIPMSLTLADKLEKPPQSATAVVKKMELFVPLKGLIDLDQEIERLSKRINELSGHLKNTEKKLANKNFVDRAPENVVKHENQKLKDMTTEFKLVKANLDMLQ